MFYTNYAINSLFKWLHVVQDTIQVSFYLLKKSIPKSIFYRLLLRHLKVKMRATNMHSFNVNTIFYYTNFLISNYTVTGDLKMNIKNKNLRQFYLSFNEIGN